MAALMAATDWANTPLGAVDKWPQSLRTMVGVLLTSRFAMWMGWGADLTFFYNDAYRAQTLGAKHPWALGRPSREVWAEIWPDIGPRIDRVLTTGHATWDDRLLLFLERSGYREETYHTFSYSPATDDHGRICGNLCVVTEETARVLGERRMALLRDTALAVATTMTEHELFAAIEGTLTDAKDLPFTLTYLFDAADAHAHLTCRTGLAADHPAAIATVDMRSADALWRLGDADGMIVELAERFPDLPTGPWPHPPTQAFVLAIPQQGQKRAAGLFVAALNPFRPLDDAYRSFVNLFVGQIAAGLANVHAYEAERRRAEALAEIDRVKTTFFSNVSHEFRTPLTLILGLLDELRRAGDAIPGEMHDQLDIAHRNGQRLLKLVNTLLDFSRIEAGRVRARFEALDLCALTADLASTFRSAMDQAGLTFTIDCSPIAEPVYVDREMWEKIVLNLLSNAFKFTLAGDVAVTLVQEDQQVRLSIRDTGVGIPAHEVPRVFERFHQVDGARGRSHEGSGIGLALVQELVKLHGGALTVDSALGRGSEFTVSIPLGTTHLPADHLALATPERRPHVTATYVEEALRWLPGEAARTRDVAGSQELTDRVAGGAPANGPRILLADDNADMREYARRLLGERWQVEVVADGRQALAAARARRPDVIVTDVMMPDLDGFGVLRELRADAALRTVPVILLSARAGEDARIEALAASADDYLVKPFSARDLLARVDAQIVKGRVRAIEQRHVQRMARLFAHAPVAIAVVSGPRHVYELTNPPYRELVGGRHVVGHAIGDARPAFADQDVAATLDRVRASGEPFVGQSRCLVRRGHDRWDEECYFDYVYQPVFADEGHVETIVIMAHDVTSLAAAKLEAETANRLKDEFLATLSHELRTPLNAVLGYAQMVRAGVIAPERLPAVLATIERNARVQEQLISDLLDVSHIITGKFRVELRPMDVTEAIQDALDTVAPTALAKGVTLDSALDQTAMPIAGDARRLQQVVWNLLSNAIKFTPRDGLVQIRVVHHRSHVELTVTDTGEGIAPEFVPQLFQRFRQGDGTVRRRHGGLGLGLAICRYLVEAHGGRIDAMSPGPGQGTTVRVELPLLITDDHQVEARDAVLPIRTRATSEVPTFADLNGRRVLLVDDEVDALNMARDALSIAGAMVVTAANGEEALSALDRESFDVVVLDIGLPEMDGYELLKAIRARPSDQQGRIPAAALSAYARTTDRTRSLQAGFQMHLAKPVQPAELTAAILALAGSGPSID